MQLIENNNEEKPADENDLVNTNLSEMESAPPGYRFSVGQLPLWAKKQVCV